MSNNENTNDNAEANPVESSQPASATTQAAASVESIKDNASNVLGTFLALKDSNPPVFFGAIGGVAALLLFLIFSGGKEAKLPEHHAKPVVVGQDYVLKSANAYEAGATIRLVAVPGSMAAYDDTEEADREGGCKHIPSGTPVKVTNSQDAYGKKDVFVEVEMQNGECAGKRGWALAINLQ